MDDTTLLTSPLDSAHRALGAKMAAFGGWSMPISYPGGGVVGEHQAVRTAVGLFDVSHLGKALVQGPGAADFVNRCLTNDLGRIGPGQAQYTMCCTPTGGVVDDLIAYLVGPDEVFLVPNAANADLVVAEIAAAAPSGVTVTNLHTAYGVLAVQGPLSADVLAAVGLPADLDYMAWADADWNGVTVRICRTGYTGEHGYELLPPAATAPALWDALLAEVTARGGLPVGLGARDTLRTEMGYPLHGQDLSPQISPLQARAGWAVGWSKPAFFGRDALLLEKSTGPARTLWGLEMIDRGIPRAHQSLVHDDRAVGEVTSGTHSPTLNRGIGLALVDAVSGLGAGDEVTVDVRGRRLVARLVKPPFVPSHVR
ncbi:MAG: glycine cleavage system aminomethyltransferase GcvT [Nakamurella sp.]